jgi:hypothetical protein
MLRGASYTSSAGWCRLGQRSRWPNYLKNRTTGFRLALAPVSKSAAAPTGGNDN